MTVALDYKFTDRDVRENPDLRAVAKEFLQFYGGDFSFLVDARRFLTSQGDLPTTTVRGVLNCMSRDPDWVEAIRGAMIRPIPVTADRLPQLVNKVTKQRPTRIRLATTWKKPYVMSVWKTAQLIHILDKENSKLWWRTCDDTITWEPATFCKLGYGRKDYLIMLDHVPMNRTICRRCTEARGENESVQG